MLINKFFRFLKPDSDTGGTATGAADRGDVLPGDQDLNPEDPDGALAAAAALKADPAVKKLEAEIKADDAEPDEPEADDKKPKAKDSRIPLARHEAILNKEREARKALEGQLAQYQRGSEVADVNAELTALETNVLKLEKEYASLLTDGEIDKAVAVMTQIRQAERQMTESKSDLKIAVATAQATERARFNVALERVESTYPALNPESEEYDAELDADVADLKTTYESRGMTPTAALQKAVVRLAGAETTKQQAATTVTPRVSDKDVAAERKKDAVAKTAAAVGKTPPSLSNVGLDSDKLGGGALDAKAVMKMNLKDFSALSAATLSEMRGDTL